MQNYVSFSFNENAVWSKLFMTVLKCERFFFILKKNYDVKFNTLIAINIFKTLLLLTNFNLLLYLFQNAKFHLLDWQINTLKSNIRDVRFGNNSYVYQPLLHNVPLSLVLDLKPLRLMTSICDEFVRWLSSLLKVLNWRIVVR